MVDRSKAPGAKRRVVDLRVPVVLPHEILHHMFVTGKVKVQQEDIRTFWSHWEANKPPHPAMQAKRHCPLGIGGDDAKYTLSGCKVVVICMNVLLWDRQFHQKESAPVDSALF